VGEDEQTRLRGAPLISVVKITDFGDCEDRPRACSGHRSMIGRVFLEPEVRASPMVVPDVRHEDAAQMRLVENDHVVEVLAAD